MLTRGVSYKMKCSTKQKIVATIMTYLLLALFFAFVRADGISVETDTEEKATVPFLTEVYNGINAKLNFVSTDYDRVQSYAGPGKSFVSSGMYKPSEQGQITVYFCQNGWVLSDIIYNGSHEERFVWFPDYAFSPIGELPNLSELPYYDGVFIMDVQPSWGPSSNFNMVETMIATCGNTIKVFFQENGYIYGEYSYEKGTARMWFRADAIIIKNANVTYTDEPSKQKGESAFGKYTKSARTTEPNDTDLQCVLCGYPSITITTTLEYSYDEICHWWDVTTVYYCPGCGIRDYMYDGYVNVQNHKFGNDNVCDDCGYIKDSTKNKKDETP